VTSVGKSKSATKDLVWGARDCFFVPSWNWHAFRNTSDKNPAVIFSVTDRPVLESLGLFREEE
jgi:gentisate 1,2-dioxygenase